ESLDVSDLEHDPLMLRQFHQVLGFARRLGQRLFHQQRNALLEESSGDSMMLRGGHDHNGGIDEREQQLMLVECACLAALRNGFGLSRILVYNTDQLDRWQARQNAGVFLTQMPHSDHSHPQALHTESFNSFFWTQAASRCGSHRDAARCWCSVRTSSTLSGWPERQATT